MACVSVLTAAIVAAGLAGQALAGSYALPSWPSPPGVGVLPSKCGSNLTVDVGYALYQGVHNSSSHLNIWKGIRYAAPPVGNLRWRAPTTPPTNRTVAPADTFGSACPGVLPPGAAFIPGGSEDCLFLNVWAPDKAKDLPVLVWIHGGGYGLGDGTQDMTAMINDNGNSFVVVSIQYRLGAFGFLSSNEVKSSGVVNAGILDQAFALSWVQSYISSFGGDPSRVTISGESAGAGSVMYHTMAAKGELGTLLFKNAIASSPYLVPQYAYNDTLPTTRFTTFAAAAGCNATSPDPLLPCLRSKSTTVLQAANYAVGQLAGSGMWYFLPVTDGSYIASLPSSQLLPSQPINGLRLLVSNNAHEGNPFTPTNITTESSLLSWLAVEFPTSTQAELRVVMDKYPLSQWGSNYERANQIYADAQFVCPSYWLADAFTTTSPSNQSCSSSPTVPQRKAYHYQYSVAFANHGADLGAVFGPPGPNLSPQTALSIRRAWGQFVTTDGQDPGQEFVPWQIGTDAKQTDFDQTGGQAVQVTTSWGMNVTQYTGPGLEEVVEVVDAWNWEGGRGERCAFWRGLGGRVLQ